MVSYKYTITLLLVSLLVKVGSGGNTMATAPTQVSTLPTYTDGAETTPCSYSSSTTFKSSLELSHCDEVLLDGVVVVPSELNGYTNIDIVRSQSQSTNVTVTGCSVQHGYIHFNVTNCVAGTEAISTVMITASAFTMDSRILVTGCLNPGSTIVISNNSFLYNNVTGRNVNKLITIFGLWAPKLVGCIVELSQNIIVVTAGLGTISIKDNVAWAVAHITVPSLGNSSIVMRNNNITMDMTAISGGGVLMYGAFFEQDHALSNSSYVLIEHNAFNLTSTTGYIRGVEFTGSLDGGSAIQVSGCTMDLTLSSGDVSAFLLWLGAVVMNNSSTLLVTHCNVNSTFASSGFVILVYLIQISMRESTILVSNSNLHALGATPDNTRSYSIFHIDTSTISASGISVSNVSLVIDDQRAIFYVVVYVNSANLLLSSSLAITNSTLVGRGSWEPAVYGGFTVFIGKVDNTSTVAVSHSTASVTRLLCPTAFGTSIIEITIQYDHHLSDSLLLPQPAPTADALPTPVSVTDSSFAYTAVNPTCVDPSQYSIVNITVSTNSVPAGGFVLLRAEGNVFKTERVTDSSTVTALNIQVQVSVVPLDDGQSNITVLSANNNMYVGDGSVDALAIFASSVVQGVPLPAAMGYQYYRLVACADTLHNPYSSVPCDNTSSCYTMVPQSVLFPSFCQPTQATSTSPTGAPTVGTVTEAPPRTNVETPTSTNTTTAAISTIILTTNTSATTHSPTTTSTTISNTTTASVANTSNTTTTTTTPSPTTTTTTTPSPTTTTTTTTTPSPTTTTTTTNPPMTTTTAPTTFPPAPSPGSPTLPPVCCGGLRVRSVGGSNVHSPLDCLPRTSTFHLVDTSLYTLRTDNCTVFNNGGVRENNCGGASSISEPPRNTTPIVTFSLSSVYIPVDILVGAQVVGVHLRLEATTPEGYHSAPTVNNVVQLESTIRITSFRSLWTQPTSQRIFSAQSNNTDFLLASSRPALVVEVAMPWRRNDTNSSTVFIQSSIQLELSSYAALVLGLGTNRNINLTMDLRPQLPAPSQPQTQSTPSTTQQVAQGTSDTTALGGVLVSPGIAMQQGVVGALTRMSRCGAVGNVGIEIELELPAVSHPLGFGIGRSGLLYSRGALISNLIVIPLCVAVFLRFVAAPLLSLLEGYLSGSSEGSVLWGRRVDDTLLMIGWPSSLILPLVVTAEGTASSTVRLLQSNGPATDLVLGGISAALIVAGLGGWLFVLVRVVPPKHTSLSRSIYCALGLGMIDAWLRGTTPTHTDTTDTSPPAKFRLVMLLNPWYEWSPKSNTNNEDAEGSTNDKGRIRIFHRLERAAHLLGDRWLLWGELVLLVGSVIVGIAEGIEPYNETVCEARVLVAFIATVIQSIFLLTTTLPVELVVSIFTGALTIVLSVVVLLGVYGSRGDDDSNLAESVAGADEATLNIIQLLIAMFGLIGVAVGFVGWVWKTHHRFKHRRKELKNVSEGRTRDDDISTTLAKQPPPLPVISSTTNTSHGVLEVPTVAPKTQPPPFRNQSLPTTANAPPTRAPPLKRVQPSPVQSPRLESKSTQNNDTKNNLQILIDLEDIDSEFSDAGGDVIAPDELLAIEDLRRRVALFDSEL